MRLLSVFACLAAFSCTSFAGAAKPKPVEPGVRWVATWAASPMGIVNKKSEFAEDTTVRNLVHLSMGGSTIRVVLTNEFGTGTLNIGGVSVAVSAGDGTIKPGTAHPVTFSGRPGTRIPEGALYLSDPIAMPVAPLSDLTVSLFMPGQKIETVTQHGLSMTTNFAAPGNQTDAVSLTGARKVTPWQFVKGVDVLADRNASAIVAFGDSITDGAQSTPGTNHRWPNLLAARLQASGKLSQLAVVDEGISGNRVLHDNTGPNALSRFDRDVLSVSGVKYVVILESINDIGRTAVPKAPGDEVTAEELIAGLTQMIERAHAHGVKVIGATLTPYEGAGYASADGEVMREKVNDFIRSGGKFDGVIDFDKATADPGNPRTFLPAYNLKDHLHPNDTGYQAMADTIDLNLFR